MADVTIADLTAAPGSAAQSGDLIEIERSGASYSVTAGWLTALARSGLTVLAAAISDSTSSGRALLTAASASAQRTALGLGSAALSAAADFAAAVHTHAAADISDSTAAGQALLTAASAAAQRSDLGLGTAATQASTAFAAATHAHAFGDVTGLQTALDGKAAASAVKLPPLALYWSADGAISFVAHEAMTLTAATEAGTGTIAWTKALAASPGSFASASFPLTLAAGDILRATLSGISGYKAATLPRSA